MNNCLKALSFHKLDQAHNHKTCQEWHEVERGQEGHEKDTKRKMMKKG